MILPFFIAKIKIGIEHHAQVFMVETVVRNAIHAGDTLLVVATKTIARSELSENIQIVWMLIDILLVIGDGMERSHARSCNCRPAVSSDGWEFVLSWLIFR